jgi:hypothetical protein
VIEMKLRRMRLRIDRQAATSAAKNAARRQVTTVVRKVYNQASVNCPVDTGNLRAQHYLTTSESAQKLRGTVGNNAKYAAAVHDGSSSHTITARRRKALRFKTGDGIVYAKSVRHPGTPGRPWLATAAQQVANEYGYQWTTTR